MLRGIASSSSIPPASYTFSTLPSASSAIADQFYFVSDVGVRGSYWMSNGTTWGPVNNSVLLYTVTYPFIVPSSGTVAANGAITLTTALDMTYANAYCYFPANVFTGSTAGYYYCTFSSTTVGQMYTTKYTSGIPSTPASPVAVSTGAGAYTQTTGSLLQGATLTISANIMGTTGAIQTTTIAGTNTTAGLKTLDGNLNSTGNFAGSSGTTQGFISTGYFIENTGVTNAQFWFKGNNNNSNPSGGNLSIATTSSFTFGNLSQLAVATDWIATRGTQVYLYL